MTAKLCLSLWQRQTPDRQKVSHIVLVMMAETDPRLTKMSATSYLLRWHRQTPDCTCHDDTDPGLTKMSAILYLSPWHRQTPESQKCQPYCICLRGTDRPRADRNVVRSGRDSDCVRMTVHGYLIIKRLEMSSCLFYLLFPKY